MAKILTPFSNSVPAPSGVVAQDMAARVMDAEALRAKLLDADHTREVFGAFQSTMVDAVGMMPTPDEVASKFANGKGYKIYDEMQRNVLYYGALINGRLDLMSSLPQNWLPGEKGDAESEAATAAVQSAWENIDERSVALRALARGIETGFAPVENVYDVHTRGKAKGLIAPVAMIDRPVNWFRFDWLGRPHFRPEYYSMQVDEVDDFKVQFLRYGSLHTRYGRGEGQDCYPAVFAINTVNRFGLDAFERFGYPIAVIVYPRDWDKARKDDLEYSVWKTWKNFLSFPGDVQQPEISFPAQEKVTTGSFGSSHTAIVDLFQFWLSMRLWGSMLSSGNQPGGSYARDEVHDAIRLEKAALDGAALMAAVNRGFVRPIMLANYPTLEESKWPRFVIDSQLNSDLRMLLEIAQASDKIGFPVSRAWWSKAFSLPAAVDPSDELHAPQAPAPAFGADPLTPPSPFQQQQQQGNAQAAAARQMSERLMIAVSSDSGAVMRFWADEMVLTENRGPIRAAKLQGDDVLVVTRRMLAKVA